MALTKSPNSRSNSLYWIEFAGTTFSACSGGLMLTRNDAYLIHRGLKVGFLAGIFAVFATSSLAAGLPGVPPLPSLPIGGGGGGGGPGGGPGAGPGGGGPGAGPGGSGSVSGGGGVNLSGPGVTLQGVDDGSGTAGSSGPNAKWGDPLSTDLLGNGSVHARLRYYGESGALGTTQAVGINLSFPQ